MPTYGNHSGWCSECGVTILWVHQAQHEVFHAQIAQDKYKITILESTVADLTAQVLQLRTILVQHGEFVQTVSTALDSEGIKLADLIGHIEKVEVITRSQPS